MKVRETAHGSLLVTEFLVWYQKPQTIRGVFLVVVDRGYHGELRTMFTPDTGREYFNGQQGKPLSEVEPYLLRHPEPPGRLLN